MSAIDLTLGAKSYFVSPQAAAQRLPQAAPAGSTEPAHPAAGSVRFENIGKTYHSSAGPVAALSGIELEIPAGSIFGIIGRSGAGKSSLLRTINRLERPTEGRVLVDGEDIAELDENGLVALRRRIGMIFQHFNLLSAKTGTFALMWSAGTQGVKVGLRAQRNFDCIALAESMGGGGHAQACGFKMGVERLPELLTGRFNATAP